MPDQFWEEESKEAIAKKKSIYKPPMPLKKQRFSAHHGRSGKVRIYTEEEIRQYEEEQYGNTLSSDREKL